MVNRSATRLVGHPWYVHHGLSTRCIAFSMFTRVPIVITVITSCSFCSSLIIIECSQTIHERERGAEMIGSRHWATESNWIAIVGMNCSWRAYNQMSANLHKPKQVRAYSRSLKWPMKRDAMVYAITHDLRKSPRTTPTPLSQGRLLEESGRKSGKCSTNTVNVERINQLANDLPGCRVGARPLRVVRRPQ